MTETEQTSPQPAIVQAFMRAKPTEQHRLLGWSRELTAIRLSDRTMGQKLAAMLALTRERQATWPLLKLIGRAMRILVWDARSWKMRLGAGSLLGVLLIQGSSAAALVPLGAGIALPLWLLVGVGGLLAGVAADLIGTGRR
ncbi:MAG: hypothetical protein EOM91_12815 [Sphingobacteriia bacterium]|nr:hypothetical protein [Sphingobacteriia bacterium]NCC40631.1 hypothetical protein [Gammaproteobacteria bacterium]